MIYNVAGLLTGKLGDIQQHEIENESLKSNGRSLRKINGSVRLMRTDRTVLVNADVEATTHDSCSRCLEPATANVIVNMEEEFSPTNADLVSGPNNRTADEDYYYDPALVIDEQNFLDLTEGLGQALLSAIPIAPVCKDDCLGICPICTVNRNILQCSCAKSSVDPRWAGLVGLLEKGAKSAE
ncbi:MAG: DUF177 domain-containing protein [Dehalococcoidia bacterium]|jgi:uncharacterized protein|nr:hypothetical protein [Chloroflexota bacterium]MDP6055601.1 DUF177 domain-containing protein [Dehalococcoidia bacterium]MDP7261344.1 DUF177 domain-containing protein [Dehalococcoidia bacterium]MDP7484435.1 DUF177 domain-containing protein [Dehalococcoidia bacterium]